MDDVRILRSLEDELEITTGRVRGDLVRCDRGDTPILTERDISAFLDLYATARDSTPVDAAYVRDLVLHPFYPMSRFDEVLDAANLFGMSEAEANYFAMSIASQLPMSEEQFWQLFTRYPTEPVAGSVVINDGCPISMLASLLSRDIINIDRAWTATMGSGHRNTPDRCGQESISRLVAYLTEVDPTPGFNTYIIKTMLQTLYTATQDKNDPRQRWFTSEQVSRILVAVAY